MLFRAASVVLLLTCLAAPLGAQQSVELSFDNGRVTLVAQNAPVRTILAEWARLGGATIVNGDRIAGPPLTLQLTAVPERQALDVLLRSVAGYMLAPRRAGSDAASTFDRILILPTSVAPRTPPPAAPTAFAPRPNLPQPQVVRRPPEAPGAAGDDPAADNGQEPDPAEVPTVGGAPRPGVAGIVRTPPVQFPPPLPLGPEPQVVEGDDGREQPGAPPQGVAPTPANPFGIPFGSSGRPGVITPPPQQPTPTTRPQQ